MLRLSCAFVAVAVVAAAVLTAPQAEAQQRDTVLRWNRAAVTAIATPGANPATVFVTRPLAMASVAMFDAANAFERRYHPYVYAEAAPADASRDAAVSQAAHDVLVALLPSQAAILDALLETSLSGLDATAARDGAAVGAAAALAVLADRTGDGWEARFPPLVLPTGAGYWVPTPPANANATFTNYPQVRGFIVPDGRQFLTEGPPAMSSARYATDLNETKAYGAVESTLRTAEQTQAARLWASVGTSTHFWIVWNQVAATTAQSQGLSGLDAARALALLNMTHHDALMTSFTGKYIYGLWRPITAIREAARDGNPATEADPSWTSLVPTPPYPGHPGNMACLGAAQARVLDRIFGHDDVGFDVTWTGTTGPNVTKHYDGFRQLADDGGFARIWGGIHFRFETLASFGACTRLGDYAADNVLRAR
jgi:hypothetical protein